MSRITITIDDIIEAQNLTSGNETFKDFDIVAVCPGNVEVFIYLCKHAEVDIICLDTNRKSFSPDKKVVIIIIIIIINIIMINNNVYY